MRSGASLSPASSRVAASTCRGASSTPRSVSGGEVPAFSLCSFPYPTVGQTAVQRPRSRPSTDQRLSRLPPYPLDRIRNDAMLSSDAFLFRIVRPAPQCPIPNPLRRRPSAGVQGRRGTSSSDLHTDPRPLREQRSVCCAAPGAVVYCAISNRNFYWRQHISKVRARRGGRAHRPLHAL